MADRSNNLLPTAASRPPIALSDPHISSLSLLAGSRALLGSLSSAPQSEAQAVAQVFKGLRNGVQPVAAKALNDYSPQQPASFPP